MQWRLITTFAQPPADTPEANHGALNMAIDQALLESVQAGGLPVLRFYRWQPACLSLGRNQAAVVDRELLRQAGVDLVRRPTGGLAVLHAEELTYAVIVRGGVIGSARESYEAVNRGLLRGLQLIGAMAVAPTSDATVSTAFRAGGSCFASTAPGEVVSDGRKLIGSAQRYERRTILQHGSILLAGDQSLANTALRAESEPGQPVSVTLRELLGYVPDWPQLTASFATGVAAELGICLAPSSLTNTERARAWELSARFCSDEWTYRV